MQCWKISYYLSQFQYSILCAIGKMKTDTFTKFGPKIGPIYLPSINNLPWFWGNWCKIFRENRLLNCDPFIYQNLGLRRGHLFTRGVKMGPYFAAHPQYLLSSEYLPGFLHILYKTCKTNSIYFLKPKLNHLKLIIVFLIQKWKPDGRDNGIYWIHPCVNTASSDSIEMYHAIFCMSATMSNTSNLTGTITHSCRQKRGVSRLTAGGER